MMPKPRISSNLEDRLPNLIIPGAAKAGTTTLHSFLGQHPQVFLPRAKEPHFFSNDLVWDRGVEVYVREHFSGATGYAVRVEATPHYLYYEKAARRIAELLPPSHQRFLVILRDPVARAYSLYWNMVHEGHENLSFEEALAQENEREGTREIERRGSIRWQYYDSGLYANQLERWFRHIPRERFLFVLTEDLQTNPAGTMDRVFDFVGLAPLERLDPATRNPAALPRSRALQRFLRHPNRIRKLLGTLAPARWKARITESMLRANRRRFLYPPMNAETQRALRERFASDVDRLQSLIGRDLSAWLPGEQGAVDTIER